MSGSDNVPESSQGNTAMIDFGAEFASMQLDTASNSNAPATTLAGAGEYDFSAYLNLDLETSDLSGYGNLDGTVVGFDLNMDPSQWSMETDFFSDSFTGGE